MDDWIEFQAVTKKRSRQHKKVHQQTTGHKERHQGCQNHAISEWKLKDFILYRKYFVNQSIILKLNLI